MKCIICESKLNGNRKKFCSNKCKQIPYYRSSNSSILQTIKYIDRKLFFVNERGGGCEKCGYSNNLAVLEFHHRNERDKSFPLDSRRLSNYSLEKLKKEVAKCDILCANCHREHHNPGLTLNNIGKEINRMKGELKMNKDYSESSKKYISLSNCRFCKKPFKSVTGKVFCSTSCREKEKGYPTKDILLKELELNKSKVEISKKFGITTKVIRRLLKS